MKVLLPSGDEKYVSFWVRDAAMMAESDLVSDEDLKCYIEIIALCGQNSAETINLKHGLIVPPYAVADHISYDSYPVFFTGTYCSGYDQGNGMFGYFPPFCDNFYFIMMVGQYLKQSEDYQILRKEYKEIPLLERLEQAFQGYNIDKTTGLCLSDSEKYTVDWGFVDTVKKSGKLLMSSLPRYNAAVILTNILKKIGSQSKTTYYTAEASKIKKNILEIFYDKDTGWLYSATGIGHQFDVWATEYAVFSGIISEKKTLEALYNGYRDHTAVVDGYVRHILVGGDYSPHSAWEATTTEMNCYQNGAYWATPTGWYAYALYKYNSEINILEDFLRHYKKIWAKVHHLNGWMSCQKKSAVLITAHQVYYRILAL